MTHAPTSLTHWGGFSAGIESGDIASVTPLDGDTDPSPLLGNLPGAGTSSLARGCSGAHVLVQVEKFTGPLPPVQAHEPPVIVDR